jgi:hypothetical protein
LQAGKSSRAAEFDEEFGAMLGRGSRGLPSPSRVLEPEEEYDLLNSDWGPEEEEEGEEEEEEGASTRARGGQGATRKAVGPSPVPDLLGKDSSAHAWHLRVCPV